MDKAIFKFNNGRGALLCSKCYLILKESYRFSDKERYEIDIHSCAIILEQIRRFGRIWYDIKHKHHIFDSKNKSK
mgnify:CR=1 FL=1